MNAVLRALPLALASLALAPAAHAAGARGEGQRVYSDPTQWGPYEVGVTEVQVRARHHRGQDLDALIWYPADVSPGAAPYIYLDAEGLGALSFTAVEDAPLVRGPQPYPVIAFSHGNGGVKYQSVFLTEHLASHGYVVISADHPGNTLFDYNPTTLVTGLFTRPLDISALLDELERLAQSTTSMFRGQLDTETVGMIGHSFGGYTTLAVSGARLNLSTAEARCRVEGDARSCLALAEAHRLGPVEDGFMDLSDPRVDAAVPLAPLGWEPFRAEGLAFLTVPVQAQGGDRDDTCPYDSEVEPVYTYASGERSLLDIRDAGHYAWSDICELEADFSECFEPFLDMDTAHRLINTWATSHFKVFLEGDSRYEVYLTPEYAAQFQDLLAWEEDLDL